MGFDNLEFIFVGIFVLLAILIISCCAIQLGLGRYQKRVLLSYAKRDVSSTHLAPLITRKNVDRKIDIDGRSACKWLDRKLPVIALSALEGNLYMMQKLYDQGADITFIDSLTRQNLLHMACSSGLLDTIVWCLDKEQIDIDHLATPCPWTDPSMTPLMHVLKHIMSENKLQICEEIITAGSDVSKTDSRDWTLLHYATIHNCPSLTTLVIKSGPLHPIFTYKHFRGYPSAILPLHHLYFTQSDIYNSYLLLEAGYKVTEDYNCLNSTMLDRDKDCEFYTFLEQEISRPSCLKRLCRTVVRTSIGGIKLSKKLEQLPLPLTLISYLKLDFIPNFPNV